MTRLCIRTEWTFRRALASRPAHTRRALRLCVASVLGFSVLAVPAVAQSQSNIALQKQCKAGVQKACVMFDKQAAGTAAPPVKTKPDPGHGKQFPRAGDMRQSPPVRAATEQNRPSLQDQCAAGQQKACLSLKRRGIPLGNQRQPKRSVSAADPNSRPLREQCRAGVEKACLALRRRFDPARYGGSGSRPRTKYHECGPDWIDDCLFLAERYDYGLRAGRRDPSFSASLYDRLCNRGRMDACVKLGWLHMRGDGVARNWNRARDFYSRACDSNFWEGCVWLGLLHEIGRGARRDEVKATRLFRRACRGGAARACYLLGEADGWVSGPEYADYRYQRVYEEACAAGVERGCILAGRDQGWSSGRWSGNRVAALRHIACEADYVASCRPLAAGYETGRGPDVDARGTGYRRLRRDCRRRDIGACAELGRLYYLEARFEDAVPLFEYACDAGDMRACHFLGVAHIEGRGVAYDRRLGRDLLRRACRGGYREVVIGVDPRTCRVSPF